MSKEDWENAYEWLAEQHVEHCKDCQNGLIATCEKFAQEVQRADDLAGDLCNEDEDDMLEPYMEEAGYGSC